MDTFELELEKEMLEIQRESLEENDRLTSEQLSEIEYINNQIAYLDTLINEG